MLTVLAVIVYVPTVLVTLVAELLGLGEVIQEYLQSGAIALDSLVYMSFVETVLSNLCIYITNVELVYCGWRHCAHYPNLTCDGIYFICFHDYTCYYF